MNINAYSLLSIDPEIMQGLPCVKGTRITTGVMLNVAVNHLLEDYPKLNKEQILQALKFAATYEQSVVHD